MEDTCYICNNPVFNPKKRIVKGVIVEQCVARCHDQHLVKFSNSWNFLQDTKKSFRKAKIKRS